MADFLQTVKERVVVYDGAMGTNIQKRNPTVDDFWGKENCSEVLGLSRPDSFVIFMRTSSRVGCDIVETNTFGGSSIVLGEFDLADRMHEINLKAAQLAREVAQEFSTKEKPRFVAGSLGPTTKLPSLGHIGFEAMVLHRGFATVQNDTVQQCPHSVRADFVVSQGEKAPSG